MVALAPPIKPLLLLNLYLDTGTANYAGKSIDFRNVAFTARVISWGTIDRSIPLPAGEMQISEATVRVADTDGQIKAWMDQITPFRRLGEIILEDENHAEDGGQIELPLVSGDSDSDLVPTYNPLFTGEIIDSNAPMGEVEFKLKSVTAAWLGRAIERLLTRDNFPNLPDDIESGFVPIIFGRCFSYSGSGYDPQGVIPCVHVDTTTHDYIVARHSCYSIPSVYRKRPLDQRFVLVDPSEYTTPLVTYTILGVEYQMQMIRFTVAQYDGTLINADVSGANFRWDFSTNSQVSEEVRNPADCLVNLIYYTLKNETRIETFDSNTFDKVRQQCTDLGYYCDGAITAEANSSGVITAGTAVHRVCSSFLIDFIQSEQSRLQIRLYQAEDADDLIIPIDPKVTLLKTLHPGLPRKVATRLRYRYAHQNAPLTEFIKSANAAQWGWEYTIDNVKDQAELARTGANPLIEGEVLELYFVRDDETAKNVAKRRMPYHTLRSYELTVELPGPELIRSLYLGAPIEVTHFFGIGDGGWTSKRMRVCGLLFDLATYKLRADSVCIPSISDDDLDFSYEGSHPTHDAQTRKPQIPVTVNGSTLSTAPKGINLKSDHSVPSGRTPVVWAEDATTEPRTVYGHVPVATTPTDCALDKFEYYYNDGHDTDTGMTVEEAFDDVSDEFSHVAHITADIYNHVYFTPSPDHGGLGDNWVKTFINDIYSKLFVSGTYGSTILVNQVPQSVADALQREIDALQGEIDGIVDASGFATTDYVDDSITALAGDVADEFIALRGSPVYAGTLAELDGRITGLDTDLSSVESNVGDILAHTFFGGQWVNQWVYDLQADTKATGYYGGTYVVDGLLQNVTDNLQLGIDDLQSQIDGLVTGSGFATTDYVDESVEAVYDYVDDTFYTAAWINHLVTTDWVTIYNGYYQPIGSYATPSSVSSAISSYNTTLRGGYTGSLQNIIDSIPSLGGYLTISGFNTAIANYFTIDEVNDHVTGDWLFIYSGYFSSFNYVDNSIIGLANDVAEEFAALRGSPAYAGTLADLDGRITGLDTDLTTCCSGGGGGGITEGDADARYVRQIEFESTSYTDIGDLAAALDSLFFTVSCINTVTESDC